MIFILFTEYYSLYILFLFSPILQVYFNLNYIQAFAFENIIPKININMVFRKTQS